MPQTSIGEPAIAFAGQPTDNDPKSIVSAFAEANATRQIEAGQPVLRGTDPETQCVAITNGATLDAATFAGWVLLDTTRAAEAASDGHVIADGDALPLMRKGVVYVQVTAAVQAGNPVYVGTATAQLGDIDDATGTGLTLVPGCRFRTSAAINGFAKVEVNLP